MLIAIVVPWLNGHSQSKYHHLCQQATPCVINSAVDIVIGIPGMLQTCKALRRNFSYILCYTSCAFAALVWIAQRLLRVSVSVSSACTRERSNGSPG